MGSENFSFNHSDFKKWFKNTVLFFAPVLTIYLLFVSSEINKDGFSWTDFSPNNIVIGSMILYIINVMIDFLKKYASDTTQV